MCASFVWRKTKDAPPAIVNRVFRALREQGTAAIPPGHRHRDRQAQGRVRLLPLAPGVPRHLPRPRRPRPAVDPATGWSGGFTCVLGNPPWDKVDFEDKEYFSTVEPSIAALAGQKRRSPHRRMAAREPGRGARYRARDARSRPRSCSPAVQARSRCAPKG